MERERPTKILLLTHGGWGMSLVEGIQMILGSMSYVHEIPLLPTDTLSEYMDKVQAYVSSISLDSLIIVDLMGGTPSNVAAVIGNQTGMKVFTGLNAPMLLEACVELQGDGTLDSDAVLSAGQSACVDLLSAIRDNMTEQEGR